MLSLGLFMRETTNISRNMMRFPRMPVDCERNDKVSSWLIRYLFATIPRIELALKQTEVYLRRSIQYRGRKQTVIQKIQDNSPPFRMWIDFLLHNDWIAKCRDIRLVRSFKYCTIATMNYDLQNKVISTTTDIFFPDLAKGVNKSEN
jgi:hypothetical protein